MGYIKDIELVYCITFYLLLFLTLQKNPTTIRIPEEDIGSESHNMDHVVHLATTNVTDKNITQLCKDAGKVLFKGTNPKLLLPGED